MQIPSCAEGLFPAVGMHSMGEEVKVDLQAEWFLEQDDGVMVVDSHEDDWGRLYDVRASGTVRSICFTVARSRAANTVQTVIPAGNSRGRSVVGGGEGGTVFSSSQSPHTFIWSPGLLTFSCLSSLPPPCVLHSLLLPSGPFLLFSRVDICGIAISLLGNIVQSCNVSSLLFLQSSK